MDVQIDGADDGEDDLEDLFDAMPEADAEDRAVDADTPNDKLDEMPESSQPRKAKPSRSQIAPAMRVAKHDCTHCPYRSWCPYASGPALVKIHTLEAAGWMKRRACR